MELNISICTKENCKVYVKDETPVLNNKGYIPEDSDQLVLNRFKYSDTETIVEIYMERYNDLRSSTASVKFAEHTGTNKDEGYEVPIDFDGVFTVYTYVIPTLKWFMRNASENPDMVSLYDSLYIVDSDSKSIYKAIRRGSSYGDENGVWKDWRLEAVTIDEIRERNTEDSTISRVCDTYVSVCHLLHCYLSLCQAIFEGNGFGGTGKGNSRAGCFSKAKVDDELIYRRDMVWMSLNVIRYLVEMNRLQEAQRIIEQIGGCNGLCKGWYEHSETKPGCGCGQSKPTRYGGCNCGN